MNKLKNIIPLIILVLLLGILYRELFNAKPNELPSALIGQPVPHFTLPNLMFPNLKFTQDALLHHVSLVNVFASWCEACSAEQAMLMKISAQYHVPIYGINYKDNREKALAWLREYGNPYRIIGADIKGDVAIDFGVYGTPETFVINPKGEIVYRQVGAIDEDNWENDIYPIIKKYEEKH